MVEYLESAGNEDYEETRNAGSQLEFFIHEKHTRQKNHASVWHKQMLTRVRQLRASIALCNCDACVSLTDAGSPNVSIWKVSSPSPFGLLNNGDTGELWCTLTRNVHVRLRALRNDTGTF